MGICAITNPTPSSLLHLKLLSLRVEQIKDVCDIDTGKISQDISIYKAGDCFWQNRVKL